MTQSLAWFALTELLLSLSPGPAVFLVVSQSMRRGLHAGLGATAGILGVNVLYFVLSVFGVGAALATSPTAFDILKCLGAAYLLWMAWEIVRDVVRGTPEPAPVVPIGRPGLPRHDWRHSIPSGVAVQATSLKNILIFLAIIPQFIEPSGNVPLQFIALCVVSVLIELPVLAGYACLATSITRRIGSSPLRSRIEMTSALLLAGIAGYVLLSR